MNWSLEIDPLSCDRWHSSQEEKAREEDSPQKEFHGAAIEGWSAKIRESLVARLEQG